jgi:dolichol-phosphate mannosyltransferase
MKLTAVVPCYYDAQAASVMYLRLRGVFAALDVDYEIIYVNEASPDGAAEVLAGIAARDSRVRVITHSRNFGTDAAFTTGMKAATGDAVVLLDGDLQDPPELIEAFYRKWREGWQVVYGVRAKREARWLLNLAYRGFYRLCRAISNPKMPLDVGDFCLMDRAVVDAMNALPESDRCIRGLRAWVGYRQTGVAFVRPERMFGKSTLRPAALFAFARKTILSFSHAPLEALTGLALTFVGASVLGALIQVLWHAVNPGSAPRGFTTMVVLVLFVGGVQMLCVSVLGWYLARIYDEVKRRPHAIVEDKQ